MKKHMHNTLSIVIPMYNEQERIDKAIRALSCFKPPQGVVIERIIFVDDGSTDSSKLKVKSSKLELKKKYNTKIQIISYQRNRGKGYALKQGMQASTSDYTLFMDADMSTPLAEIQKFVPYMRQGADVIVGTRRNGTSTVVNHQPLYREILGRGFTKLTQSLFSLSVTDITCGFKMFSREAKDAIFAELKSSRWSFDAEVLYLTQKLGFTLKEVAVEWHDDPRSKVNVLTDIPLTLVELFSIWSRYMAANLRTYAQSARSQIRITW